MVAKNTENSNNGSRTLYMHHHACPTMRHNGTPHATMQNSPHSAVEPCRDLETRRQDTPSIATLQRLSWGHIYYREVSPDCNLQCYIFSRRLPQVKRSMPAGCVETGLRNSTNATPEMVLYVESCTRSFVWVVRQATIARPFRLCR